MNPPVPFSNRLAGECSPYLLQHATNPVDWYPWGEEAFERARQEEKPVFLSIGYSSCHWCHVMAHESFEDPEVAAYLNENFISVKVDREERPDLDDLYMAFIHALIGRGGWPMSVFLTPDRRPFYGGTYFPRQARNGMPGFLDVLIAIRQSWDKQRGEILRSSEEILKFLQPTRTKEKITEDDTALFRSAFRQLSDLFDSEYGGFGREPKFPCPHQLMFLFRYAKLSHTPEAAQMAQKTLYHMYCGGIYDRIGGGFHRYSTDRYWRLPHFEKMLADQAMMIYTLSEAYQYHAHPLWKQIIDETVAFVIREMRAPEGGFYTALDADSPDGEGAYYLWTEKELRNILKPDEFAWVREYWNVAPDGNYFDESTRKKTGANILYATPAKEMPDNDLPVTILPDAIQQRIARKLFHARNERPALFRDEKILSDWNGLMIAALSKAAGVFRSDSYLHYAASAVDFFLTRMHRSDGYLWRRWMKGQAGIDGVLDDYAFMVFGLVHYYQISARSDALVAAIRLIEKMVEEFRDDENHGFFIASKHSSDVILNRKTLYDGAYPSGNSVAAWDLAVLGMMTGRDEWVERAKKIGDAFCSELRAAPAGFTFYLSTVDLCQQNGANVLITGNPEDPDYRKMIFSVHQDFYPHRIIIARDDRKAEELDPRIPMLRHYPASAENSRWYLCSREACFAAGDTPEQLHNALTALASHPGRNV